MATTAGGSTEQRDRRDGWRAGPGLVLADGATWHLPTVDAGLIPYLADLVPATEALLRMGQWHRETGVLDPDLPDLMAAYLVAVLSIQYRTDAIRLAELARNAASVAGWADPSKGLVLVRHLVAVRQYAAKGYRVDFAVAWDGVSLN